MIFNYLKTFVPFLCLGLFVACTSQVEDVNNKVDNSTFELGQVELVSAEVMASDRNWPDLKDKALFSFRTCITDKAYLQTIAGEQFSLTTSTQSISTVTNTQGCITWNESVDFNYLEDEKYIENFGKITATGNFKGTRPFRLAMNPWREQAVDLGFGSVQATVSELHSKNLTVGNRIAVTNASVSILSQNFHSNQTNLNLEIMTRPLLMRRNLNGALIKEAFNGGSFRISYFLISKNVSTNIRSVISEVEQVEKIAQDGRIKSQVNFNISEGIDPKDIIEIALRVTAENAPIELGVSEGYLPVRQLEGTTSSELIELPESLNDLVRKSNYKIAKNPGKNDFGFIIDSVSIKPGAEGGENMTGNSDIRKVDASFQVCIIDSLIKDTVKNYPFEISLLDESGKSIFQNVVTTEMKSGCLNFRAGVPFRRYEVQSWKKYRLVVTSTTEPFIDISKDRLVYINPWIKTSDFGIDSQVGKPPVATVANKPGINIQTMSYNFMGHSQSNSRVNKSLDLLFTRSYMIEMNPMVYVNHNFNGDSQGQERLMTGNYRMRFLILAPKSNINVDFTNEISLEDFYTLSASSKDVSVDNGTIRTQVDLPLLFSDLIPFSFRNVVLVEITPLEANTALQAGYFVGIFNGSKKQDVVGSSLESKRDLSTKNLNISRSLISRINLLKNKLASDSVIPNNKSNFIKVLGEEIKGSVQTIDHLNHKTKIVKEYFISYESEQAFKAGQGMNSTEEEIRNMIDDPTRINARQIDDICNAFYPRSIVTKQSTIHSGGLMSVPIDSSITGYEFNRCKSNFRSHVNMTKYFHAASIVSQPTALVTNASMFFRNHATIFSDSKSMAHNTGSSKAEFFTHGWSVSAGASLSKIVFLGADYGVKGGKSSEVFVSDTNSSTLANNFQSTLIHNQRYDVDKFSVNLNARVIKCLLIVPKVVKAEIPEAVVVNSIFSKKKSNEQEVTSPKRIYACKANTDLESLKESFYFVKTIETGTMNDDADGNGKMVNIIRGDKAFNEFKSKMIDTDKTLIFMKSEDKSLVERFDHHMSNHGSGIDYKKRMDFSFPGLYQPQF